MMAEIADLTERNSHQLALTAKLTEIARDWGVQLDIRYLTTDEIEARKEEFPEWLRRKRNSHAEVQREAAELKSEKAEKAQRSQA